MAQAVLGKGDQGRVMKILTAEDVHAALSYPAMIDALQEAYSGSFNMPPRQVFLLDDQPENHLSLIHISEPTRPY